MTSHSPRRDGDGTPVPFGFRDFVTPRRARAQVHCSRPVGHSEYKAQARLSPLPEKRQGPDTSWVQFATLTPAVCNKGFASV